MKKNNKVICKVFINSYIKNYNDVSEKNDNSIVTYIHKNIVHLTMYYVKFID